MVAICTSKLSFVLRGHRRYIAFHSLVDGGRCEKWCLGELGRFPPQGVGCSLLYLPVPPHSVKKDKTHDVKDDT